MSDFSPTVAICCNMGCDTFPIPPWCNDHGKPVRPPAKNEVYDYLMGDAGLVSEKVKRNIVNVPGDKVVWYLACSLDSVFQIDNIRIKVWSDIERCSDLVRKFVSEIYARDLLAKCRYDKLVREIAFAGNNFSLDLDIHDYLLSKKHGRKYIKHPELIVTPADVKLFNKNLKQRQKKGIIITGK